MVLLKYCGIAEVLCGIAEILCDIAEVLYGIVEVLCGIVEILCGIAEILCDIIEVLCCIAEILCCIFLLLRAADRCWQIQTAHFQTRFVMASVFSLDMCSISVLKAQVILMPARSRSQWGLIIWSVCPFVQWPC